MSGLLLLITIATGIVFATNRFARTPDDSRATGSAAPVRRGGSRVIALIAIVGGGMLAILFVGSLAVWFLTSPQVRLDRSPDHVTIVSNEVYEPVASPVEATIPQGGPLPDWVYLAENRVGRMRTVVLVSPRLPSLAECERAIADSASGRVAAYLRELEPKRAAWDVTEDVLARHAYGRRHTEEFAGDWRQPQQFRVYRELRLAPELASLIPSSPANAPLPEWIQAERDVGDDSNSRTLLLVSRQYATVDEAEEELLDQATNRVRERFHAVHPPAEGWDVPEEIVRAMYSPRRHVEELERSSGEHTFRVHRVHRELHIPADLADAGGPLYPSWRHAVVERRLRRIGGGVVVATFTLFLASLGLRRARRRSDESPTESSRGGGKAIGVTTLAVIVVLGFALAAIA